MNGYLKLHRSLLHWEWYDDASVLRLWIHLLLRSNFVPGTWHGISVGRGELITSLSSLSEETGLSVKQVRTALGKLKKTGEVACRGAGAGTLVSITNWDKFQSPSSRGARSRLGGTAEPGQASGGFRAVEGQQYNTERKIEYSQGKNGIPASPDIPGAREDGSRDEEASPPLSDALREFRQSREASGRPLTARAERLLMHRLYQLAGDDQKLKAAILEQSVVNGWTGVFPMKAAAMGADPFLSLLGEEKP